MVFVKEYSFLFIIKHLSPFLALWTSLNLRWILPPLVETASGNPLLCQTPL